jgi:hypothetical protein
MSNEEHTFSIRKSFFDFVPPKYFELMYEKSKRKSLKIWTL